MKLRNGAAIFALCLGAVGLSAPASAGETETAPTANENFSAAGDAGLQRVFRYYCSDWAGGGWFTESTAFPDGYLNCFGHNGIVEVWDENASDRVYFVTAFCVETSQSTIDWINAGKSEAWILSYCGEPG